MGGGGGDGGDAVETSEQVDVTLEHHAKHPLARHSIQLETSDGASDVDAATTIPPSFAQVDEVPIIHWPPPEYAAL